MSLRRHRKASQAKEGSPEDAGNQAADHFKKPGLEELHLELRICSLEVFALLRTVLGSKTVRHQSGTRVRVWSEGSVHCTPPAGLGVQLWWLSTNRFGDSPFTVAMMPLALTLNPCVSKPKSQSRSREAKQQGSIRSQTRRRRPFPYPSLGRCRCSTRSQVPPSVRRRTPRGPSGV